MPPAEPEACAGKPTQHGSQTAPQAAHHYLPVQTEHEVVSKPDQYHVDAHRPHSYGVYLPR